jgi:non-specific serine/threonine protein kinase
MHWGLTQGEAATTLVIASALEHYWWAKGQCAEGLDWIDRAFAASPVLLPIERADGLRAKGSLLKAMNQHARAQRVLREAIALAREAQDGYRIAAAELSLGEALGELGDAAGSLVHLAEAVDWFRRIGNPAWLRSALSSYGLTLVQQDRALDALDVAAEMARLFEIDQSDDPTCRYLMRQVEINALRALGRVVDPALADELLDLTDRIGSAFMRGGALQVRAMVALDAGEIDRAAALLTDALTLQLELDDAYAVSELLIISARLAAQRGDGDRSARFLGAADGLARSFGLDEIPFCAIDHAAAADWLRDALGVAARDALLADAAARPWKQIANEALAYATGQQPLTWIGEPRMAVFPRGADPAAD